MNPTDTATLRIPDLQGGAAAAARSTVLRLPATLKPHGNLLRYYLLSSVLFGPAFVFAMAAFYLRFRTLRYELDDEGITMRWGVLFRREISLTYARIQDIQLRSNAVERWLRLARIEVQTASGNASAEMTIEGVPDVAAMRDFLYSRMRGAAAPAEPPALDRADGLPSVAPAGDAALESAAAALSAAVHELRQLRMELQRGRGGSRD